MLVFGKRQYRPFKIGLQKKTITNQVDILNGDKGHRNYTVYIV